MNLPELKYRPIVDSFQELGKDLRKNVPHVVIGQKKLQSPQQPRIIPPKRPLINPNYKPIPPKDLFNDKEQQVINKIKKWGLAISITAVVCYALYRILFG